MSWCGNDSAAWGARYRAWRSCDVVLHEERNPSISDRQVAEATVRMKGTTLHAREASPEMALSIHKLSEDVKRQVKKHREMRAQAEGDPPGDRTDARATGGLAAEAALGDARRCARGPGTN